MKFRVFDYKSPDFGKIVKFGFSHGGGKYSYSTGILGGQFEMRVNISESGEVNTEVIDLGTGEPYTLHLVPEAAGSFVGSVRAEHDRVLSEIAEKCFVPDVFKGEIAHGVIEYVRSKYGGELEFLWEDTAGAIWRRKDNRKWYGLLLVISKNKLKLPSDESVPIIDVRIEPAKLAAISDGKKYFPGYHMNKKNWPTVCLDGSVPLSEICELIDASYVLAAKK